MQSLFCKSKAERALHYGGVELLVREKGLEGARRAGMPVIKKLLDEIMLDDVSACDEKRSAVCQVDQ